MSYTCVHTPVRRKVPVKVGDEETNEKEKQKEIDKKKKSEKEEKKITKIKTDDTKVYFHQIHILATYLTKSTHKFS